MGERRFQYEAEVSKNPLNYDSWFDYVRLEEAAGDHDKVREVCAPDCGVVVLYVTQWLVCCPSYAECKALSCLVCARLPEPVAFLSLDQLAQLAIVL